MIDLVPIAIYIGHTASEEAPPPEGVDITAAPYNAIGDAEWAQTVLDIVAGTTTLTASDPIWAVGDVGKSIVLPPVPFGSPHWTTIAGFTSATQITLADNATSTLTGYDAIVAWGTDSTAAFQLFKDDYQGDTGVVLTIPAGKYLISSGNFEGMWNGITEITVNAAGATLCGGTFTISSSAQYEAPGHMAYTASVAAGATSVTLLTPAEASRFVVGDYAMMTGFDMQMYGYPINQALFEYVKIASIVGAVITFTTPLVNGYLSTWPVYNATGTNYGGPATLYAMNPKFEHTAVINGLTVAHHGQWGTGALSLTFNDCVFEGIAGPFPSMGKYVTYNNCTGLNCTMEVDKLVTSMTMTGCTWLVLNFQSGNSNLLWTMTDTTITGAIVGSPWKMVVSNSTINLWGIGPPFFGYANELVVSDSEITNWTTGQVGRSIRNFDGGAQDGIQDDGTMVGGVITIPPTYNVDGFRIDGLSQWAITGSKLFMQDPNVGNLGSFTITDVAQSGDDIIVTTDWTGEGGGFPVRVYGSLGLWLQTHPAPVCTFTNVTGCAEAVDLSRVTAGVPIWSHTIRDYTGDFVGASPAVTITGRIKYAKVTVTTPYTGVQPTVTATVFPGWGIDPTDYSTNTNLQFSVNLKEAGERILDVTAPVPSYPISWTGAETGDTLPALAKKMWVGGYFITIMNADITGESPAVWPEFTVEFITDQEFA